MIDNWFEFELNGVKYKGKSVGGDPPLRESGQALRAQNAQLVQGEDSAVFNMRPDVLVFSWTDWSGGEGQFALDPQEPGRYHSGRSIDGFSQPGALIAGPAVERTKDSTGSADFTFTSVNGQPSLVFGVGEKLYAVLQGPAATDGKVHIWDDTNKKWDAGVSISTAGNDRVERDAVADGNNLYINNSIELTKWDGTTFTLFANNGVNTMAAIQMLGEYVYQINMSNPGDTTDFGIEVREYIKSGTPLVAGTLVYSAPQTGNNINWPTGTFMKRMVCNGPNRVYIATVQGLETVIHEIIPTTAAGAGSGAPIAMIPAQGLSLEWSGGLLFLHCSLNGQDSTVQEGHGVLMYVNPTDGTYGVVDKVRPFSFSKGSIQSGSIMRDGASLAENFIGIMSAETSGGTFKPEILVFDTVNGALHPYARAELGHSDVSPVSLIRHRGELFFAEGNSDAAAYIMRLKKGYYEGDNVDPMVISPVWDFGLVDEKVLSSIRVTCEAVPTNWSISVDYDLDESGSWTNAGSVAATQKGATFTITTDSSTKKFRQLRLRASFVWAGSGDPTTTPTLLGIEARAQVTQKLRSWTVILDCSDDQGQAQNQSLKGHQKIDNIQTAGTPGGNAVAFKNGFSHRQPNQYDEYDVVVDDYEIFMQRPGEGYAVVRLIEVA